MNRADQAAVTKLHDQADEIAILRVAGDELIRETVRLRERGDAWKALAEAERHLRRRGPVGYLRWVWAERAAVARLVALGELAGTEGR